MNNTHTITINGEPREIIMSYGLLNELTIRVGDIDNVSQILFDHDLRQDLLSSLLCDRDVKGRPTGEVNFMTAKIDSDEVIALLNWAGEHVLDFFLKSFSGTKAALERNKDRLGDLQRYLAGSKA